MIVGYLVGLVAHWEGVVYQHACAVVVWLTSVGRQVRQILTNEKVEF